MSVTIQFMDPSITQINFTPVTYSGAFYQQHEEGRRCGSFNALSWSVGVTAQSRSI